MDEITAIKNRHSVRSYTDKPIEGDVLAGLQEVIDACNKDGGLSIKLCLNEAKAFSGMMAKYGKFVNVKNYIALIGKKAPDLDERCGYYGEQIVIKAQQLGLNTCWVAMSYSKGKVPAIVKSGEKLVIVITVGYGSTEGVPHKVKSIEDLSKVSGPMPDWFKAGMEAVRLAPTAMNQQKFTFELTDEVVNITAGSGFYTQIDMGIAKYHFEVGSGKEMIERRG